ncbi:UNVERIFIED_CONTAM: hypothetical protein Slati_3410500 [Sesamum latifolium]|uniref:Reverse transcriptase domain-containing protein n=1 Tax=Sesamum latifolium TaxID=2727402 RepID=A0AAW2UIJ1_9LAMI
MSPIFFQHFWPIIGKDVVDCVLDFLHSHRAPAFFNSTHIVLIPKCDRPKTVSHFRPISLCNMIYKIASKVIANRLKPLLSTIIFESQSAFIPGYLITDNVLIAYELNHYLAHKHWGKEGHIALKLDISKTYDQAEWLFVERVLGRLGFHDRVVSLVMACVSTVTFSSVLNGSNFGFIRPKRGLHQEAFSRMIQREESLGLLKGVAVSRSGPRVSHLLFADDTLLFVQTTHEALLCIRRTLQKFEEVSRLAINWQKSAAGFSKNMEAAPREELGRVLGVATVEKHEKYLGLPTVMGRSKRAVFEHIKERVWNKMQHWRSKFLSQASRSVLLKAMVQAVPSYVMSVFRIPDTLLGELESMMPSSFGIMGNQGKFIGLLGGKCVRTKMKVVSDLEILELLIELC